MESLRNRAIGVALLLTASATAQPNVRISGNQNETAQDVSWDATYDYWVYMNAVTTKGVVTGSTWASFSQRLQFIPVHDVGGRGTVYNAKIVNIASPPSFLVTFEEALTGAPSSLQVRVIDARTGAVTDTASIQVPASGPAPRLHWDTSGNSSALDSSALIALRTGPTVDVREARIDQNLQVTLGPATSIPIQPETTVRFGLPKQAGSSGRRMMVMNALTTPGRTGAVQAFVFDRHANLLEQTGLPDAHGVDVDGQDDRWIVAYDAGDTVRAFAVFWNSRSAASWRGVEHIVSSLDQRGNPNVMMLRDSCLIAFADNPMRIASIDPFDCTPCMGPGQANWVRTLPQGYAVRYDQGTETVRLPNPNITLIRGTSAIDGRTTDQGGGCGGGGRARAHCAFRGNQGFEIGLRDAPAGRETVALLSASPGNTPCGPCTLVPDLASSVVLPAGATDGLGNARIPTPLPDEPALFRAAFYLQWLTLDGTSCLGGLVASNGLRVEIE